MGRSHDLVVPPWAEALPCCLFVLVKFFYLDLLLPDDTFVAAIRKVLIAIGPLVYFASPFPNLVVFLIYYHHTLSSSVSGVLLLIGGFAIWGPLYLGTFVFAKCQPHRAGSGAITDLWAAGTCAGIAFTMLGSPIAAWHIPLTATMYISVFCRAPRRAVTCVACAAVGVVSLYNRASVSTGAPARMLIAVPDAADRRASTLIVDLILFSVTVVTMLCLEIVLRESDRRHAATRASSELAKKLAAALSHYDTKAAEEALDEAEAQAGETTDASEERADPELVEGFRAIVRNLDEYRPHLPNWLVNKHSGESPRRKLRASGSDDDELESLADDNAASRGRLDDDNVSVSARSRSSAGSGHHGRRTPRSKTKSKTKPEKAAALYADEPTALLTDVAVFSMPQLRTVAMAELQFSVAALAQVGPTQRAAALHGFVDRVHEVARATKAAVHTFVGDAVVASWNAARSCAYPEAKAARFAARLRETTGLTVTGALVTGPGTVLMAGLGEQRALVLSLQADRQALLRRASQEGARRDVVLLSSAMAHDVAHVVGHRVAALVPAPGVRTVCSEESPTSPNEAPRVHVLHAITKELPADHADWVYVLEQQRDEPAGAGLPAADNKQNESNERHLAAAVAASDWAAALKMLTAAPATRSNDEHARLVQEITDAALHRSVAAAD